MPITRTDRDHGYAREVSALPTIAELKAEGKRLAKEFRAKQLGLTVEQISQRTRPTNEESFRKTYGISVYQYEEMWYAQGGKCAICETPQGDKLLATDHDHNTGKVRGLLCTMCNQGLGHFRDNTKFLWAALEYLRNA